MVNEMKHVSAATYKFSDHVTSLLLSWYASTHAKTCSCLQNSIFLVHITGTTGFGSVEDYGSNSSLTTVACDNLSQATSSSHFPWHAYCLDFHICPMVECSSYKAHNSSSDELPECHYCGGPC
ncbi:hypothetical protein SLE2022_385670 [Rubroshorea leprosula]